MEKITERNRQPLGLRLKTAVSVSSRRSAGSSVVLLQLSTQQWAWPFTAGVPWLSQTVRVSSTQMDRRQRKHVLQSCELIPMTHVPETGTIYRLHFTGASFWYVCHGNLGPDSSGTRFWHRSLPSQKVAYTQLRNTAQKYIINIVHKSKFLLSVQCFAQHWTEYKITLMCLLSAPELFSIPDASGGKNWHSNSAPDNGASFWSMCHRY